MRGIFILVLAGCATAPAPRPQTPAPAYPSAHRGDQVDDYHGVRVADPYRWLEDLDAPATRAWIDGQVALTSEYLKAIPERPIVRKRLEEVWNYERFGVPFEEGGRIFYTRNDGLQNQSVLYVSESIDAPGRVLLDPNTLREDGTVSLKRYSVSEDGKKLAYQLSDAGSDWVDVKVRDIDTGKDLPDHLKWVKFSGLSWLPDGSGFLYSRYDEPTKGQALKEQNYFQKLYLHRLGTDQSADVLIYERKDEKEWGFGGDVSDDGKLLIIEVWMGAINKSQIFYRDLAPDAPNALFEAPIVELLTGFDAEYSVIDNDGRTLWVRTNLDAPRGRVVAIDLDNPDRSGWKVIIPEAEETLLSVSFVGGSFFARYLKDAHSLIRRFTKAGVAGPTIELPGLGTVRGFGGERDTAVTFYRFDSFTLSPTIYRYDVETAKASVFRESKVAMNLGDFTTSQVWVTSKDGTKFPMFISHRKDLDISQDRPPSAGPLPTYLYGYGGFDVSLTPRFSPVVATWLEMGGIFAQPTLRGGGEYGEDWHQGGMKTKKQNVFDDFIAAAEYLQRRGLTSPELLAIAGGSNGGLLVGACLAQRPGLYGAALPAVGVMDMLRFQEFTIGWAWVPEYGSSKSEDPAEFKALYAYSPLHTLRPGAAYPATLITTADHDDRVFPAHSFKFAAALQHAQPTTGGKPALIRIETRAGHGAGTPTSKRIEEAADKLSFLVKSLKFALPQEFGEAFGR